MTRRPRVPVQQTAPLPKSGEDVVVAGIISGVRPLKTRKGDRMGVFTLEDRHGGIEVVVYTEPFARFERLIENGGLVVVRGRLDKDDEESRLYASEIAPIESVRERLARELAITDGRAAARAADVRGARRAVRPAPGRQAGHAAARDPRRGTPSACPGAGVAADPREALAGVSRGGAEDLWRGVGASCVNR